MQPPSRGMRSPALQSACVAARHDAGAGAVAWQEVARRRPLGPSEFSIGRLLPSKSDSLPVRIAPDHSWPWAIQTDVTDSAERGDLTVGTSPQPGRDAPDLTNRASSTCKICTTSEAANSTSLTPSGWHLSTATLWNHPSGVGSTSGIPVWSKNSICFESDHGCGPDRLSWESIPKRN